LFLLSLIKFKFLLLKKEIKPIINRERLILKLTGKKKCIKVATIEITIKPKKISKNKLLLNLSVNNLPRPDIEKIKKITPINKVKILI
tara:strand:- start:443 stop:706 length:264 start_codon:yes stop_codon:yes gene_type:complete